MKKQVSAILFSFYVIVLSTPATAETTTADYKFHAPDEFIDMMNKSTITYSIEVAENIKLTNLITTHPEPYLIDPYSKIKCDKDGSMTLIVDEPKGEVKKIHELAAEKLKQKNYDELIKLYNRALELDNSYFKTWTNLGDTYYLLGKYDKAERCLLKAIELNDIAYQEHYFLADVYDKMGNSQKALKHITYAYMLNKNNPNIKKSLHRILEKNNLKLKSDRLELPFQINKISDTECNIAYQKENGLNWMPMANCLACWKMEPSFQDLLNNEKDAMNMKMTMYKECILNQVAVTTSRQADGKPVLSKEKQLHEAVNNEYLNTILYWEIMAGEAPQLILVLPKKDKERIVQYIQEYVYEKK